MKSAEQEILIRDDHMICYQQPVFKVGAKLLLPGRTGPGAS